MGTAYGFDIDGSFRESGQEVLDDATELLSAQYSDVTVHAVLEQGPASMVLTGTSASSRLLVLGPDDATPWYSRLFRSRVSRSLAQNSQCPVVVVPDSWTAHGTSRAIRVTLLLDGRSVAHGPLRYAFEHAARHDAVLRIVHLEATDGSHDEEVPWPDMHRLIASWKVTYPHVRVTTRIVVADADLATVKTFERTGLLVIGRPHVHHVVASLHRSLARAVIEHADCPVAVVPADYDS